jgi:benzoyl-CoA reductase/2-hydroxyglutaryl-CoA dehydratase subunit BcrC/BadD/HgdB
VEAVTGRTLNADTLRHAIHLANERRRVLERLYRARQADPVPISGKDALLISQIAFYDDPERFISQTDALCEELEQRVAKGIGVFPKGAPRLLISGSPQAVPNWKLHHIIENSGAVVVCEETCTGTRYFANRVDEGGATVAEQLQRLADRYMGINCACFTPNPSRIEDIIRLVKEYRADGVVHYNLQFCHNYSIEYHQVERALKEAGIPVIKIETDYGEEDNEQIRTRIEAFIEMLR